jgi:hypothetical protein
MNSSAAHRCLLTWALCACLVAGMACAGGAWAGSPTPAANATITFRKVFKSSYPEYVEIKVSDSGAGTFDIRQLNEESNPRSLHLNALLVHTIFDLAAKLHDFDGVDLEIHRRIANLGEKTFGYDRDGESHSVTFNYTLNRDALELLTIFEGLARQQTDLSDLDRTMHYDPLGVNDVLIELQKDLDNKLVPEPAQFLPLLDRLAADQHFIDIARDRARKLAASIRSSS